jgi:hypothetical protein
METNKSRADRAKSALDEYMQGVCDPEDVISDLLADLMHLCDHREDQDQMTGNFETELARARRTYDGDLFDEAAA